MVMCLIYLGEFLGAPTWLSMKIDPPVPHSAFIAPMGSHGAPGLAGGARALDRGEPLAPEPLAAAGDGDLATFL